MEDHKAKETNSAASRVTLEQRQIMLEFLKAHSEFAAGRFVSADGAKVKARLLNDMTEKLNAVGGGCTKSGDKWFKCWQDWKSDVKKKAAKIRQHRNGTGGGPPCKLKLTDLEEEVIQLIGPVAVTGQEVADRLEVQLAIVEKSTDNPIENSQQIEVASIPCGTWIDALLKDNTSTEPSSDVSEKTSDKLDDISEALPRMCTPSTSTEGSSSSSNSSKRIRRKSKNRLSESSLGSEQIAQAAMLSAEAKSREASMLERSLTLQEEMLRFKREEAQRQHELAREELEIKRRRCEIAEKKASALECVGQALNRLCDQMGKKKDDDC